MRVLVTRPAEDSLRTAQELAKCGHQAVVASLFETRIIDGPELQLEDVQAILATSGNGIRALARQSGRRDIPVLSVGTRTAAVARAAGFSVVIDAREDAETLATVAIAHLRPEAGPVLHAAGGNSTLELVNALAQRGFAIRRCVLYELVEVEELPPAAVSALRGDALDAVLIFSPRSSRLLAERIREAGLANSCKRVLACCISTRAANALEGLTFRKVHIASHPNHDSLLDLLQEPACLAGPR
ncbi:MAG TPA: uroporphyrinogen-III synthase [Rhizomicrobium sp.]|jgi:uroporphyrinogen-III synthase|nr:uroporphyrinogen-III synthase [Rhizomicrobium sp.]